jgi:putative hydrolase of the HAD superfamily
MFKNIISDFGKVLVYVENDIMTSPWVSDEADRKLVGDVVFDRLYWNGLDDGTLDYAGVKAAYRSRLPERLWDVADKVLDNWLYNLPPIEGMKELYDELREKGAKLYLLSNICIEFTENYRSIPETGDFLASFDGLVFSGPLHITKPSKEIFEHLLAKYDLKAEDCIFIDDSPINVAGAEAAGIRAYLFDGDVIKLREFLLK